MLNNKYFQKIHKKNIFLLERQKNIKKELKINANVSLYILY